MTNDPIDQLSDTPTDGSVAGSLVVPSASMISSAHRNSFSGAHRNSGNDEALTGDVLPAEPSVGAPGVEMIQTAQAMYDFFTSRLFEDRTLRFPLPPVVLSFQRDSRAMGYFKPNRYAQAADPTRPAAHEIALNPAYFFRHEPRAIAQTLVHEICHLVRDTEYPNDPATKGYHDRLWGDWMRHCGLEPSSTGAPGGKATGVHMNDFPIPGGRFARLYEEFVASHALLKWGDRLVPSQPGKPPKPKRISVACPRCDAKAQVVRSVRVACWPCSSTAGQLIEMTRADA
jgi:hypothetical protein